MSRNWLNRRIKDEPYPTDLPARYFRLERMRRYWVPLFVVTILAILGIVSEFIRILPGAG